MNDRPEPPAEALPEAVVETRRQFPVIWLVPLAALLSAIWLAVVTVREQGPTVSVRFENAEGLEAGTTKVKYKNVDIGLVESVRLLPDLSGVVVRAAMARDAEPHLREGTRFWVAPAASTSSPPSGWARSTLGGAGSEYVLTAERLGSINPGSPVSYRELMAGEVLGHELAADQRTVDIYVFVVFVREPFDRLVRNDTRFWNASGIDLAIGAEGVSVTTDSVQAILTGGIAFDTHWSPGPPARPGRDGLPAVQEPSQHKRGDLHREVPTLMHFDGSVRGPAAGAPVEFRGLKVGTVENVSLVFDPDPVPCGPGHRLPKRLMASCINI